MPTILTEQAPFHSLMEHHQTNILLPKAQRFSKERITAETIAA